MTIRNITPNDLRKMGDQEALILQGCGGDLTEWVDGVNSLLTQEGILQNGFQFEEVYTFRNDNLTCLMFPLEAGNSIDIGKLAMWCLATHHNFAGTWLSDYVENRLGGFARDQPARQDTGKPDCPLIGQDGNIFNLMGIASRTLKEHGLSDQAQEMQSRITQCQSYDSALAIIGDYVNITAADGQDEDLDEGMVMR
ncbi:MAG TPA: hypothetical protein IAC31_09630 [Candidatus Faecousia intestinigallinarum]|nr:hypothetical protein [Candidatus Faecousia intestinigallinarum]